MTSVLVDSLGRNFRRAFDLVDGAIRDCPDDLWLASMWEVPAQDGRRELAQCESAPWAVAWHALERLDFILTGGLVPWEVWPRLAARIADGSAAAIPAEPGVTGHTGLGLPTVSPPWTQADLLAYSAYCQRRVAETLEGLTDEQASRPLGRMGEPYVSRVVDKMLHLVEHGAQIRQFITASS